MACVLIVDSEGIHSRSLAYALKLEGFHVEATSSAQKALDVLAEKPGVDLMVIDLMIPELNGLDLARLANRMYPTTSIVLTSAYPLSQRHLERAECGAIGFVPKPYEMDEVTAFLRSKLMPIAAE